MDGKRVTGGLILCACMCVLVIFIGMIFIEPEFIFSQTAVILYVTGVGFFVAALIVYFLFGRTTEAAYSA